MNKSISRRSGGQILVDALRIHGVCFLYDVAATLVIYT